MSQLPKPTIHSIVSKMMINDELRGSWDQPTSSIVMHNVEPSRLQALALQYTEKVAAHRDGLEVEEITHIHKSCDCTCTHQQLATVVESNERVLDAKLGGYTGKYDPRLPKEPYSRGTSRVWRTVA